MVIAYMAKIVIDAENIMNYNKPNAVSIDGLSEIGVEFDTFERFDLDRGHDRTKGNKTYFGRNATSPDLTYY